MSFSVFKVRSPSLGITHRLKLPEEISLDDLKETASSLFEVDGSTVVLYAVEEAGLVQVDTTEALHEARKRSVKFNWDETDQAHLPSLMLIIGAPGYADESPELKHIKESIAKGLAAAAVQEWCLHSGEFIDQCLPDGKTVLHLCAVADEADCIRSLFAARANPEVFDQDGLSPLHYAAQLGNPDSVVALLEAGAAAGAKTRRGRATRLVTIAEEGRTALELADQAQASAVVDILTRHIHKQ